MIYGAGSIGGTIGARLLQQEQEVIFFARGAGDIETDFLNGEIVLLGRRFNVPTPLNLSAQRLAHEIIHRKLPPGSFTSL